MKIDEKLVTSINDVCVKLTTKFNKEMQEFFTKNPVNKIGAELAVNIPQVVLCSFLASKIFSAYKGFSETYKGYIDVDMFIMEFLGKIESMTKDIIENEKRKGKLQ